VSIAITNHETLGNGIVARRTLLHAVPIFVAIMVWLIRVLLIGTFSTTGDRLFGRQRKVNGYSERVRVQSWQVKTQAQAARSLANRPVNINHAPSFRHPENSARPVMSHHPVQSNLSAIYNPAPRTPPNTPPESEPETDYDSAYLQSDPEYVPVGMTSRSQRENNPVRM